MFSRLVFAVACVALFSFVSFVEAAQYGTAEEAKAMLEKAVAAVKADKTKALEESLLLPLELAGRQRKLRPASGPVRPLSRNEGPLKLVPPKLAGVLPGAVPAEDELRG